MPAPSLQFRILFYSHNLGQNKWNIWTTLSPISMMPKWRLFAPSRIHYCFGGMGDNCSILYCPRLSEDDAGVTRSYVCYAEHI